ncbi:pimeloyl-ACP methyl ester carboxylesterase [Mucilaginibacter rubeus]|uniref:alpha/beta hydrolase n=1 Tax=Mucilaginibacter rubeus TaxID=2027860 RepID=UPI003396F9FD
MKTTNRTIAQRCLTALMLPLLLAATLLTAKNAQAQQAPRIKNVVLVHGAFADGSGWRALFDVLTSKGYNVTIVQNPLTSLEADVEATKIALDKQDGPTILVGHSWGGSVITEAGNHPKVAALVYVSAVQPDKGESALTQLESAPAAKESGILPPDSNGIVYYEKSKFHGGFCADVPAAQAAFMYASQGRFYAKAFATPITDPAWRHKPTYACVATEDKTINPIIQRTIYARSKSKVTEIKGSHVIFMSQPVLVAKVIEQAATENK